MMKKNIAIIFVVFILTVFNSCQNPVADPPKSSNAELSGITISAGVLSPSFAAGTMDYTASVPYSTNTITVSGSKSDSKASVVYSPAQPSVLIVGNNTITATVTAEDGTFKSYTINVTRQIANSNTNLSGLTISSGTLSPVFDSSVTSYSANVPFSTNIITVSGSKSDSKASVVYSPVQPSALIVGNNTITATVTAEDGTFKSYTINVTRQIANSNPNLSGLNISSGTLSPVFDSSVTSYSANVPFSTNTITVSGSKSDSKASVVYSPVQPSALVVGNNTISATVTAEDGTAKKYTVVIKRELNYITTPTLTKTFTGATNLVLDTFDLPAGLYKISVNTIGYFQLFDVNNDETIFNLSSGQAIGAETFIKSNGGNYIFRTANTSQPWTVTFTNIDFSNTQPITNLNSISESSVKVTWSVPC